MTTRDALIAACRAAGDDSLPRLVFADFLDETGSDADAARAALIRYQCDDTPGRLTFRDGWVDGDFDLTSAADSPASLVIRSGVALTARSFVRVARGFVVQAECDAEWWLRHGDDLVREHDVQTVQLTTIPAHELSAEGRPLAATLRDYDAARRVCVPVIVSEFRDGYEATDAITLRLLKAHWPSVAEWRVPTLLEAAERDAVAALLERQRRARDEPLPSWFRAIDFVRREPPPFVTPTA